MIYSICKHFPKAIASCRYAPGVGIINSFHNSNILNDFLMIRIA